MIPDGIGSYPSIFNLGHPAVRDLTAGPVIVEEKIDGSQFSFGVYEVERSGGILAVNPSPEMREAIRREYDVMKSSYGLELRARSKGKQLVLDAPEKMFERAVETIREIAPRLRPNWTYRGEYLSKPKHNVLAYDRVPAKHIIIFDITDEHGNHLSPSEKRLEAHAIGLECVPALVVGLVKHDDIRALLDTTSVLGGQKIEGVVVKPLMYDVYGVDKKVLLGKYVSEAFKEIHGGEFRKANPTSGDIITDLIRRYRTPARWNKAVQHLRERGELTDSPADIGKLMKEVSSDVHRECADEIREALFKYAWPKISRGIIAGLPEHYKQQLLEAQFATVERMAS
jgi:hypothetical protein